MLSTNQLAGGEALIPGVSLSCELGDTYPHISQKHHQTASHTRFPHQTSRVPIYVSSVLSTRFRNLERKKLNITRHKLAGPDTQTILHMPFITQSTRFRRTKDWREVDPKSRPQHRSRMKFYCGSTRSTACKINRRENSSPKMAIIGQFYC